MADPAPFSQDISSHTTRLTGSQAVAEFGASFFDEDDGEEARRSSLTLPALKTARQ